MLSVLLTPSTHKHSIFYLRGLLQSSWYKLYRMPRRDMANGESCT